MKQKINNFNFYLQKKLPIFDIISEAENIFINSLKIKVDRPIFICGMPRSGTTYILNLLNNSNQVSSCTYGQLPFYKTPLIWNFFKKYYYFGNKSFPRLHGDGIEININSPDAFEELIWAQQLNNYYDAGFCQFLEENFSNLKLEKKITSFIKKITYLNKKNRYLSKGNYYVFRLNFINKIFKDCKIILCYRNPLDTASSLERVHNRFLELSSKIEGFDENLQYLSHFEFGKLRKAFKIDENSYQISKNFFKNDKNYEGYLYQWISLYQMIIKNYLENQKFSKNLILLNYDKFILDQKSSINKLSDFCELEYKIVKNHEFRNNYKKDYKPQECIYNSDAILLYKNLSDHNLNLI